MQYRAFGNTGEKASIVSFGCIGFTDEEQAAAVVSRAIDLGVNYFESCCRYCGGNSEPWLGRGLGDRRAQVMVSTKSAPGEEGYLTADDVRKSIDESLAGIGVDYLDFYHAWRVSNPDRYAACTRKGGWLDGVRKAMDEGLIRHLGITSHAPPELLMTLLDDDIFEVVTVQYSVILTGYRKVVKRAREKNMGVVVMGPLAGGLLAAPSPILKDVFAPDEQVPGALKYVLCDPGVSTAASTMMTVEEVEANCRLADELPETISIEHQEAMDAKIAAALGDDLAHLQSAFCSGCRYCASVCPKELAPFGVFKPYNMAMLKGDLGDTAKLAESAAKLAEECTGCRECETVCPQKLEIPEHLERVRDTFSGRASG